LHRGASVVGESPFSFFDARRPLSTIDQQPLQRSWSYAFSTLPALRQDVHTRARRVLVPCLTRTRWIFGSQRRLERLWEKLTCFPYHGSFPQISQRYDMRKTTLLRSERQDSTVGRLHGIRILVASSKGIFGWPSPPITSSG
jgi:hypothetical protein